MKNLLILLGILISYSALSQNPQLFEDTWYIQKLTINDSEIFPPDINQNVTEHIFIIDEDIFSTGYCDFLGCNLTFDDLNNSFDINSILELGDFCTNIEDDNFNAIYYNYLEEHFNFNPYVYEITNENGIRFLELTNANGNKALYANQLLANGDNDILNVSIFPNPVKNELFINTTANIEQLEIYSITGQLVKQQTSFTDKVSINMENLIAGVYFVKLTTNKGLVSTLKIVKN